MIFFWCSANTRTTRVRRGVQTKYRLRVKRGTRRGWRGLISPTYRIGAPPGQIYLPARALHSGMQVHRNSIPTYMPISMIETTMA